MAKYIEAEHPRGKGEHGGEWIKKVDAKIGGDLGEITEGSYVTFKNPIAGTDEHKVVRIKGDTLTLEDPKYPGMTNNVHRSAVNLARTGTPDATPAKSAEPKALTGRKALLSVPHPDDVGASHAESKAIFDYQNSHHVVINDLLRNGRGSNSANIAQTRKMIADINSAFDKAPPIEHPIRVHRGTGDVRSFLGPVGSKVGQTFTDNGVISTSTDPKVVAERFSGGSNGTDMSIMVPAGAKALTGIIQVVEGLPESEVLLKPGTKFRVKQDTMKNGRRQVKLEVLP